MSGIAHIIIFISSALLLKYGNGDIKKMQNNLDNPVPE